MLAHGFTIEQMVELVRAGLAARGAWSAAGARSRSPACGFTEAGRRALAELDGLC
jgi:hypothetical protein